MPTAITTDILFQYIYDFTSSPGNVRIVAYYDFADFALRGQVQAGVYGGVLGTSSNYTTTPYPTFVSIPDMASYYQSTAQAALMSGINGLQSDYTYSAGSLLWVDEAVQMLANTKQNTITTGSSSQYLKGDLTLGTFPTNVSAFSNDAGYVTSGSLSSTLSTYATTSALTSAVAGKQNTITTGTTSQYLRGDLSLATFPSIPAAQIQSDWNQTNTSSLDYIKNKPTIATRTFNNPSRSLNTAFQISTTQDAIVTYSVDVNCTMSLTSGQSGTVVLEYADDSGITTNVKTVCKPTNANSGTLTIGLALTQINGATLNGVIPASKYARLRTVNNTGAPTFTLQNSQEVLI